MRGSARHALFMPLHYERNYAYPLVVWLHGSGEHEQHLRFVMPQISLRNYGRGRPLRRDRIADLFCGTRFVHLETEVVGHCCGH